MRVREQLTDKTQYAERLQYLLRQRSETVDALRGTIDLLRQRNQKLGLENDCLAALLVAPAPKLDAA
jgi:hypothetical protein